MTVQLDDLKACPIDQLLPKLIDRFRRASLADLAEFLEEGPATGGDPLPTLARAVVSLPPDGSKLAAVERAVVLHALATCKGNVSATARLLGVNRKALERRIRRIRRTKPKG